MRRRARALRRKGTWLNAIGAHNCSVPLSRNVCLEEGIAPFTTDLFLLVDNPLQSPEGSVSTVGEATLVRLVGEICLFKSIAGTPTSTWIQATMVNMGIYVADADNLGVPITRSPTLDVENGDWLWKGTYADLQCGLASSVIICAENDPFAEGTNSNGAHIDIRVKRKLKRSEMILLACEFVVDDIIAAAGGTSPVATCQINGNVRAYVLEP